MDDTVGHKPMDNEVGEWIIVGGEAASEAVLAALAAHVGMCRLTACWLVRTLCFVLLLTCQARSFSRTGGPRLWQGSLPCLPGH